MNKCYPLQNTKQAFDICQAKVQRQKSESLGTWTLAYSKIKIKTKNFATCFCKMRKEFKNKERIKSNSLRLTKSTPV